eukprot:m.172629 g.172629  ORF g.172629 m.172629 type:complete len:858 (+) comp24291_c0_seq2:37-2610(+)
MTSPQFVTHSLPSNMAASAVTVMLTGWGHKEGSVLRSWKRRFFIARTASPTEIKSSPVPCTHLLLYYKTKELASLGSKPAGVVPLMDSSTTVRKISKKIRGAVKECLVIETPGRRNFLVAPESARSAAWMRVLTTLVPPPNADALRQDVLGDGQVVDVTIGVGNDDQDDDGTRATTLLAAPGADAGVVPAVARLLLPDGSLPEVARLWLDRTYSDDPEERNRQYYEGTSWVVDALCHAHEDPRIKQGARELLANRFFTANLDSGKLRCFDQVLRPGLKVRLDELGGQLLLDFVRSNHASRLASEVVTAAVGRPEDHPLAVGVAGERRPTQIDVLPCLPPIDLRRPAEFPDDAYAHALLLVAKTINAQFQAQVIQVITNHNTAATNGTAVHAAAVPKAHARVMTKATSDYRSEAPPASQCNVDVVRCLVTAETPEELVALAGKLSVAFGGVVRLKNLFVGTAQDRAERFHLLPLMLTVAVDGGTVYRDFMQRPEVRAAVDRHIAAPESGAVPHRWAETAGRARSMLESEGMATVPVRVLGELQLMLSAHTAHRHHMHEVYKAYRAETPVQLYEDFRRTVSPDDSEVVAASKATLWQAVSFGNRPAVEAFLRTPDVQINALVHMSGAATAPIYEAALRGHTDVVQVLIDAGADVEKAKSTTGSTPLLVAAQKGHIDVVRMLLGANASVDLADGTGITPLWMASRCGYADVVQVLLDSNGAVDAVRPSAGDSPLCMASQQGHAEVVRVLLRAGAQVNKLDKNGNTPLLVACAAGNHGGVVRALVESGADVNHTSRGGDSPFLNAAFQGSLDCVSILLDSGADIHFTCSEGVTARGWAEKNGHTKVAARIHVAEASTANVQ